MKVYPVPSLVLFLAIGFISCQSGDRPPQSAEEARDLVVGKTWVVKDMGYLVTSFRESKGKPFVHTIDWFSAMKELGPEEKSVQAIFSKATLHLDENKTPNEGTASIAHLEGLSLGQQQTYYFTSTQEENGYDRTVKLYVNVQDSTGAAMQYPFTILGAGNKKLLLMSPREINPKSLVLSLEAQ